MFIIKMEIIIKEICKKDDPEIPDNQQQQEENNNTEDFEI
jgi:hypothetical protein